MVSTGSVAIRDRNGNSWLPRLMDASLIALAHLMAVSVYHEAKPIDSRTAVATLLAVVCFGIVADANGLYSPSLRRAPRRTELGKAWLSWSVTTPLLLSVAFATKTGEEYSRVTTISWFVLAPTLISLTRLGIRKLEKMLHGRGVGTRLAYVVGATKLGAEIAQRIMEDPQSGLRVRGYFDDREPQRLDPMPAALGGPLGGLDDLLELARTGKVDVVYVTLPLRAESRINEIVRKLADTTASVYVVADFLVFDLMHAQWSDEHGLPVVSVFESPFYGVNGWLKRAEDIVLSSLILLLIAAPMLFIAIGVKLTSPGPVFFRQRRYGLKGEEIRIIKFRSMTVTEDGDDLKQATQRDQRVTPFGALLRRTSLDELPQFLNVLMGEMSIVGPRPHAISHNELYRRLIHGYMLRHKVRPGITGWAQVSGWRGETDTLEKMEQRVIHDLHYIQNWDLLFDLRIILKTVIGARSRQNAY